MKKLHINFIFRMGHVGRESIDYQWHKNPQYTKWGNILAITRFYPTFTFFLFWMLSDN